MKEKPLPGHKITAQRACLIIYNNLTISPLQLHHFNLNHLGSKYKCNVPVIGEQGKFHTGTKRTIEIKAKARGTRDITARHQENLASSS